MKVNHMVRFFFDARQFYTNLTQVKHNQLEQEKDAS